MFASNADDLSCNFVIRRSYGQKHFVCGFLYVSVSKMSKNLLLTVACVRVNIESDDSLNVLTTVMVNCEVRYLERVICER